MSAPALAVVAAGLLSLSVARPVAALDVVVRVDGLRSCRGQVLVSLFDQPRGYPGDPEQALARAQADPIAASGGGGRAIVVLGDVAPGRYALSVAHDEDGDFAVATGLFGIPHEGVGGTWDPDAPQLGPPRFADASFDLDTDRTIEVAMTYMAGARRRGAAGDAAAGGDGCG